MKSIRNLMIMFFLFIFFGTANSNIINIDYYYQGSNFEVILEFDKEIQPSDIDFGWNESRTVYYMTFKGINSRNSFLPISKGILEGIQVVTVNNSLNVFFFLIVPSKIDWYVLKNRVIINMPKSVSEKKYSFSYFDAPLDVVIRDFSQALGINISLYNGVRNKRVNLDVNNVYIEEGLRLLFLNNPEVCYAYAPDGTLYLGLEEEISNNFARYWQIYDGKIDSEKIRKILNPESFVNYINNKSKLFIYGGIREHKLVAEAISNQPSMTWYYYDYYVDKEMLENFLNSLSSIYDFKYAILEGLGKVAIYSDEQTSNNIGYLVSILEDDKNNFDILKYISIKVKYPERVAKILDLIGISYELIGEYVKVPKKYKELVESLNNDRVIGNPYRMVFEDIEKNTVKMALDYLGISEENGRIAEINGKVFVTLFVNETVYKRFMQFIDIAGTKTIQIKVPKDVIEKFNLKILKKYEDGSYLLSGKEKIINYLISKYGNVQKIILELKPDDPPKEVFIALLDATPIYETNNILIFENNDENLKEKIEDIRKKFGVDVKYLKEQFLDENEKSLLEEIFGITIYETKGGIVLKGRNLDDVEDFINKYLKLTNNEEQYYIEKVNLANYEEIKNIIKEIYDVDVMYFPGSKFIILKGTKESVNLTRTFIEKYNKGKTLKLLNEKYDETLSEVLNEIGDLKVFKYDGKMLLLGDESEIEKAEETVLQFTKNSTVVELCDNFDVDELEKLLELYFDNKVIVKKINGRIYLKGDKQLVNIALEKIKELNNNYVSVVDEKISINVSDYSLRFLIKNVFEKLGCMVIFDDEIDKKVNLNVRNIDISEFIDILNNYGVSVLKDNNYYHIGLYKNQPIKIENNRITINATNITIGELVRKIYPYYGYSILIESPMNESLDIFLNNVTFEEFEKVLKTKVNIIKDGSFVTITDKENISKYGENNDSGDIVSINEKGLISINAENIPLKELIKLVVKNYNYSAIISKNINSFANMFIKEISFDDFIKIMSDYNISVDKKNNIYVFDSIGEQSTKTTNTFVFSVPKNVDKIQKLIEFYGGKSFVDSAAGVVIATGIDARISAKIQEYINKYLDSKLALIKVKVIDEEFADNVDLNFGEITSKIGTLSGEDFNIELALSEISMENIMSKLLSIGDDNELKIKFGGGIGESNKNMKILANPNIVAKSGEKASILIGDKIPIVLNTSENGQEIKYIESGVTLEIVPFINADNTIDLELNIKVSSFDWDVKNQYALQLPLERTREFTSKISLKENQTLIIGGLTRDENSKAVSKIPILGDLPIIGKFFSTEKINNVKRNITILISAEVVK